MDESTLQSSARGVIGPGGWLRLDRYPTRRFLRAAPPGTVVEAGATSGRAMLAPGSIRDVLAGVVDTFLAPGERVALFGPAWPDVGDVLARRGVWYVDCGRDAAFGPRVDALARVLERGAMAVFVDAVDFGPQPDAALEAASRLGAAYGALVVVDHRRSLAWSFADLPAAGGTAKPAGDAPQVHLVRTPHGDTAVGLRAAVEAVAQVAAESVLPSTRADAVARLETDWPDLRASCVRAVQEAGATLVHAPANARWVLAGYDPGGRPWPTWTLDAGCRPWGRDARRPWRLYVYELEDEDHELRT